MGGAPRLVAYGVALLSAAACSLLTPLDGFADDPADAGASEDARVVGDLLRDDGGALDDAGALDGGDGRSFCERVRPVPTFCDDFDRSPAFVQWSQNGGADYGTFALDNGDPREGGVLPPASPPYSARIQGTKEGCATQFGLSRNFTGVNSELRVRLRARRDVVVGSAYFAEVLLENRAKNGACFVILDWQLATLGFHLQNSTGAPFDFVATSDNVLRANAWVDLDIAIVKPPNGRPQLTVHVDGVERITRKELTSCALEGLATLQLTAKCGTPDAQDVHFDDVVVDRR